MNPGEHELRQAFASGEVSRVRRLVDEGAHVVACSGL